MSRKKKSKFKETFETTAIFLFAIMFFIGFGAVIWFGTNAVLDKLNFNFFKWCGDFSQPYQYLILFLLVGFIFVIIAFLIRVFIPIC